MDMNPLAVLAVISEQACRIAELTAERDALNQELTNRNQQEAPH